MPDDRAVAEGGGPKPKQADPVPVPPGGEPRVAYAVVSGEYSDYRVHALFTTRELAKAAIRDQVEAFLGEWDRWEDDKDWYDGDKEKWLAEKRAEYEIEEFPWYDDATPLGKEVQRD